MQPGFQVLYCICKLQINGIACYYVSGEETSINLNMLVNRSIGSLHVCDHHQKSKMSLDWKCSQYAHKNADACPQLQAFTNAGTQSHTCNPSQTGMITPYTIGNLERFVYHQFESAVQCTIREVFLYHSRHDVIHVFATVCSYSQIRDSIAPLLCASPV